MPAEVLAGVREKLRAVEKIADYHRAEYVQLKVSGSAAEIDRHVVTEYLAAHHRHRLDLGRIHLARHDRAARLVLGNHELANAAARTGSEPPDVVGDFHQR